MSLAKSVATQSRYAYGKQVAGQYLAARFPGVALAVAVASAAMLLAQTSILRSIGINAVVPAFVLGAMIANLGGPSAGGRAAAGLTLCRQSLLRVAIILYGFRITLAELGAFGVAGFAVDGLILLSTLAVTVLIGRHLLKMDATTAFLIGAGNAICGAAAVLATEAVLKARADQVAVALATVVLFGTAAIFLYPLLYQLNQSWQLLPATPHAFAVYAGSTVQEVAQVIAIAKMIGADAVTPALIAKMGRVTLLPLFLFALAAGCYRRASGTTQTTRQWLRTLPWFAVWFLVAVCLNSALPMPEGLAQGLAGIGASSLTVAMAAFGLSTDLRCMWRAGRSAILLGALAFMWLIAAGALVNRALLW